MAKIIIRLLYGFLCFPEGTFPWAISAQISPATFSVYIVCSMFSKYSVQSTHATAGVRVDDRFLRLSWRLYCRTSISGSPAPDFSASLWTVGTRPAVGRTSHGTPTDAITGGVITSEGSTGYSEGWDPAATLPASKKVPSTFETYCCWHVNWWRTFFKNLT